MAWEILAVVMKAVHVSGSYDELRFGQLNALTPDFLASVHYFCGLCARAPLFFFYVKFHLYMSAHGHKHTGSVTQNHKAQLANAYNELGKELASSKIRVVGNYTLGKVIGEGMSSEPILLPLPDTPQARTERSAWALTVYPLPE